MKHLQKALAVVAIMVMILATSISPALARVQRGGVLLHTTRPCEAQSDAQKAQGSPLLLNPDDRAPGCWVELPSSATQDD
jgi:hypothetical protein